MIDQLPTKEKQIAVIGLGDGLDVGYFQALMPSGPILLDLKATYQPADMPGFGYWRL